MRREEDLRQREVGEPRGDSQYGNGWWAWGPLCFAPVIYMSPLLRAIP